MLAHADDFGPRGDVGKVRSDARRLLAQRVRATGVDPKSTAISDVVVVKDQALLSWDSGRQHGVMGLVRYLDRWWDAFDAVRMGDTWHPAATFPLPDGKLSTELLAAASPHNPDVAGFYADEDKPENNQSGVPVSAAGGTAQISRADTAGYDLLVAYSANNAPAGTRFARIYGRAPTAGEILPVPPPLPGFGGASDVFYFDLELSGAKPVMFEQGTKVDIWIPFVLDDSLSYRVSFVMDGQFSKSIHGTVFDNVLHFELPAFSISPPNVLQAEVEGFS